MKSFTTPKNSGRVFSWKEVCSCVGLFPKTISSPARSSVLLTKKNITYSLPQKILFSCFFINFSCWRQLTYQWSFTKFPTCFIVDFQPWKSFHSQSQFSCVHHKSQTSRIHLLHETTFKGTLHMQPYIPLFIHGDL